MKIEAEEVVLFKEKRDKLALKAARWASHGFWNFWFPFRIRRLGTRIEALDRILKGEK